MCFYNFLQKPIIRSIFLHLFVRKKIKWFELASTVLKRRHRFENSLEYTNIWFYLDMNIKILKAFENMILCVPYSLFNARYYRVPRATIILNIPFFIEYASTYMYWYTKVWRQDLLINQMFIDLRQK